MKFNQIANLTWHLLTTYYIVGTANIVFHELSHLITNSYEVSSLLMPSVRWRNQGIQKLSGFSKVTQLINAEMWHELRFAWLRCVWQIHIATTSVRSINFQKGLFSSEITQNEAKVVFWVLCSSDNLQPDPHFPPKQLWNLILSFLCKFLGK